MAIQKRTMKGIGIEMPILGMGLMRLPMKDDVIDEEQALEMVSRMYDAGVRYFDTAYIYGKDGASEKFAKRALTDRYPRDSFYVTSKLPVDMVNTPEDAERIFSTSCERIGVDYLDFYLLHGINYEGWCNAKANGCNEFQRRLKAEGRILHRGFSFHGSPEDLQKILDEADDWEFVQLQLNYYDWYNGTAKEQYEIASAKGLPIIVMEPVRGGALVEIGEDVRERFLKEDPNASNAEWAMRWIGSKEAVNVVLSGVSTLEQVNENVKVYAPLRPITEQEEKAIVDVVETIKSRPAVPCTGCNYCSECPMNINIPGTFRASNEYTRLHNIGGAMWQYYGAMPAERRADNCIECGLCASRCPQHLDVPALLKECHARLTELKKQSDGE